jgi:hypothetical protein
MGWRAKHGFFDVLQSTGNTVEGSSRPPLLTLNNDQNINEAHSGSLRVEIFESSLPAQNDRG